MGRVFDNTLLITLDKEEKSMYDGPYSLPKELTAEVKLFNFISIRTLLVLLIFVYVGSALRVYVYPPLQIPFMVFNAVVGLLLCVNSQKNKGKRLYQATILSFFKDRNYYKPISNTKSLPQTIKQYEMGKGLPQYVEPEE